MIEPLLLTVDAACSTIGLKKTALYTLIAAGRIGAVKAGGRTLIPAESLRRYAESLPAADIRTGRRQAA